MAFAGLLGVPTGSTLAQLIRHKVSKRKIIIFLMVYSTSRKYTAIVQNKQIGKYVRYESLTKKVFALFITHSTLL